MDVLSTNDCRNEKRGRGRGKERERERERNRHQTKSWENISVFSLFSLFSWLSLFSLFGYTLIIAQLRGRINNQQQQEKKAKKRFPGPLEDGRQSGVEFRSWEILGNSPGFSGILRDSQGLSEIHGAVIFFFSLAFFFLSNGIGNSLVWYLGHFGLQTIKSLICEVGPCSSASSSYSSSSSSLATYSVCIRIFNVASHLFQRPGKVAFHLTCIHLFNKFPFEFRLKLVH